MSRRNKRNNRQSTPPSQRKANGPERTYQFTEPPAPPPLTDTTKISIGSLLGGEEPRQAGDDGSSSQGQRTWDQGQTGEEPSDSGSDNAQQAGEDSEQAGFGSRGNRLVTGVRSRILYPDRLKKLIEERTNAFATQLFPRTLLEWWLVEQLARGTVQGDLARDQLDINVSLAARRVDTPRWAEDRRERAEKLGKRLSKAPCLIAGQLGRCKYGALYLIDKLSNLAQAIASTGGLDDGQRECLFDLLGLDHVYRNGSQKVPANGPALAAVVEEEKARLTRKIECELEAEDLREQAGARLGIIRYRDQETRNLRGNETRADRRVVWARMVLAEIRAGVDPATIVDPETGQPIKPHATFTPPAKAAPPPPRTPPEAPAPEADAADATTASGFRFHMPAILNGCSEEVKQMFILMAEAEYRHRTSAGGGNETPPAPGPVAAA